MAEYNFSEIEKKWQKYWAENSTYKSEIDTSKPKFYALDMFPYPSGAGLHVGHPLGYIASDIVSRFKGLKGYNVLHPMGFDAFGLPAEQYAIQTGQHPAVTTEENIQRYKAQLKNIGFSYDWDKEVRTSDPKFYRWTQWIFMKLFNSWYSRDLDKAVPITDLVNELQQNGNKDILAVCDEDTPHFSAAEWNKYTEKEQQQILLQYRLAYLADTSVNWCPALGTVLSNDEVKDGFSERGGHPVVRKKMVQWMMRISSYAERLLTGLDTIDWPEPLKEMQRNWIGKSIGAELDFDLCPSSEQDGNKGGSDKLKITVFTTRIDTIFGVTYLALAPENELVKEIVTPEQKDEVLAYAETAANRSERERMMDVKSITGAFTGAYATHPFNGEKIPIWVADYVLAGYGTGAVMAVPAGDQRDYDFAKHFDLPIIPINDAANIEKAADPTRDGKVINSDFLNGLSPTEAINKGNEELERRGIGTAKVNYRMRDAIFTRQRYWGEPLPVYYKDGLPYLMDASQLPVVLPEIDKYLPTEDGEPPLGRAKNWTTSDGYPLELSTMPGWAGSSWYFFRYMDVDNDQEFVSKGAQGYWQNVDLYIGGSEHATGHLLYSRFWTKFLYDQGLVTVEEPFEKLINQGMIQGMSSLAYRLMLNFSSPNKDEDQHLPEIYLSRGIVERIRKSNITNAEKDIVEKLIRNGIDKFNHNNKTDFTISDIKLNQLSPIHVDINMVHNDELDLTAFKNWRAELQEAIIITEANGRFLCGQEVEKMSKRYYNVVNPDDIVNKYGADTLRLYEMFLGPLEQFKPWNTNGIDGVFKFLRKLWNLFHDDSDNFHVSDDAPTKEELKTLHRTIKKAQEDIEKYSFNTSVSEFMICVNQLTTLKCNKASILKDLVIVVSPYAPHMAEELWQKLGNVTSITKAEYPLFNEDYLIEQAYEYPVSVNGKMRTKMKFPVNMPRQDIEKQVLASEVVQKWLEGKNPKKVIIVPQKIVNVVI